MVRTVLLYGPISAKIEQLIANQIWELCYSYDYKYNNNHANFSTETHLPTLQHYKAVYLDKVVSIRKVLAIPRVGRCASVLKLVY